MKDFVKYINTMNNEPFPPKKANYTTTILMPELDTTEGIYRTLLPAYIMNKLDDCRVCVIGITERTGIGNNAKDYLISQRLIKESDHVVFPFVSYPIQPIIDEIRKVKKEVKFSYYIDFNFYTVPESYPHAKEYMIAKMIDVIEMNIKAVDQAIFTNKALRDYVGDKIAEKYKEKFGTNLVWQPLFVLPEIMKTDYEMKVEKDKVKVLIIGDEYHFSDINWIKGILYTLKGKYKDKVKLIMLGFNGLKGKNNYLRDLDFEYKERVPYYKYFELLTHISPDVLLIPANKSTFNNTSKNYVKYLELALLNVPVIAPLIKPYGGNPASKDNLIVTNQNGFCCESKEDYLMQLECMFTAREKFDGVLGTAYATATDYNIALPGNIEILTSIYFPKDGPK